MNDLKRWVTCARNHFPWDYMGLILLSYLIPAIYGLLNRYFIGYMNYDSVIVDQSYEALEVTFEVLLEMFPIAVLALVAQNYKDKGKIKGIIFGSIVLQIIISLLFIGGSLLFVSNFIDWINTPASVRELATHYFQIKTLGLPFQAMSVIFIIAIKAMKRGGLAIFLSFLSVLVNFSLDAVFISNYPFSLHLGLIGSAWNSLISNGFAFILSGTVLLLLLGKESPERLNLWENTKNIFRIGKWSGFESAVRNLGYIMGVVSVVNIIGGTEPDAIGGYNTAMWVMWAITLIPILAWTESTNIAVGHAYGENDVQAMKDIQIISTILMTLYMLLWIVLGYLWWGSISSWLNSGISGNIVGYSVKVFQFLIIPYIFFTIGSGLKSFFIGTGRPASIFVSSAIVNVAIYIPLGLLARSEKYLITFNIFLWVSIAVFSIDLVLTIILLKWNGYSKLPQQSN